MVKTEEILAAFCGLDISKPELIVLAHSVDFDAEMVPEDQAVLLRDAWTRCKRGENRVEAFWAWISDEEPPEGWPF